MEAIIVAVITSVGGLIGVIVTNIFSNKSMRDSITSSLDKHQAVQDTKIDELTREVREHNNFAKRMPVVEEKISNLDKRLTELERK